MKHSPTIARYERGEKYTAQSRCRDAFVWHCPGTAGLLLDVLFFARLAVYRPSCTSFVVAFRGIMTRPSVFRIFAGSIASGQEVFLIITGGVGWDRVRRLPRITGRIDPQVVARPVKNPGFHGPSHDAMLSHGNSGDSCCFRKTLLTFAFHRLKESLVILSNAILFFWYRICISPRVFTLLTSFESLGANVRTFGGTNMKSKRSLHSI